MLRVIRTPSSHPLWTSFVNGPFRLLLAELPQYLSKHHDALDRLYALLAIVRKVRDMIMSFGVTAVW